MVDKSGAGGLDDWEVKIADFVVLLEDNEGGCFGRVLGNWGLTFRYSIEQKS